MLRCVHETLLLSLDDLPAVTHDEMRSRSGLDRCLCRHGFSNLKN